MRTKVRIETRIVISLSEREAEWLRGFVQNLHGPAEESSEEYDMRKELFDVLTDSCGEVSSAGKLVDLVRAEREERWCALRGKNKEREGGVVEGE